MESKPTQTNQSQPDSEDASRDGKRPSIAYLLIFLIVLIVSGWLAYSLGGIKKGVVPGGDITGTEQNGNLNPANTPGTTTPKELKISQVFPANASTEIPVDALITVIFNQPVVPLVISEDQTKLPNPLNITPEVAGQGEWLNTSVFVFRPERALRSGQTYSLKVKAGLANATKELQLEQDKSWSFKTQTPSITFFQLGSGQTNPDNGLQNILLDETFRITFQQPMDQSSTESALKIKPGNPEGIPLSFTTQWNKDSTEVVITPTERMQIDSDYLFRLDNTAKAKDGGGLAQGIQWNFHTVPEPQIVDVLPADQSTQSDFASELSLRFASPMKIDTVKDKIKITPQPAGDVEWWYNDWDWSLHSYALQPSTHYTVEFLTGMQDIYGNTIESGRKISFTTGAFVPQANIQMPYSPAFYRQGVEQQNFYVSLINVKNVDLALYQLKPEEFVGFQNGSLSQWQYQPPASTLVWKTRLASDGPLNQTEIKEVQIQLPEDRALDTGFYFLTMNSSEINHDSPFVDNRLMVITNANLAFKSSDSDGLVWLTDLTNGKPIPDIHVNFYDKNFAKVADGTTDEDGIITLPLPQTDRYDPRYASTDDSQVFSFASNTWGSGSNQFDMGMWSGAYSATNQPRAYLYTERPIYRPGQPVYFKGIVRLDDDLKYRLPSQKEVEVTILSFDEIVWKEQLSIDDFGSFSGEFKLASDAALGTYQVITRFPGQDSVIGEVSFSVAEYRKPEFSVKIQIKDEEVVAGVNVEFSVDATYYSGGNVANGDVHWSVIASGYTFQPGDQYAEYSFSDIRWDEYPDMFYQSLEPQIVAEGQSKLDSQGHLALTLPAELGKEKISRQLTFEADVTDIGGNVISGRSSVVVHQSQVYVGIKPAAYVGKSGEEQAFGLITSNWSGTPIANQKVKVIIVEKRWHNVQEQKPDGRVEWSSKIEEIPVENIPEVITDGKGMASVTFVPSNGGEFKATACTQDEQGRQHCSSQTMWVSAEKYISWQRTNDHGFKVVADQVMYKPGDVAHLLIASPYEGDSTALITVERGHIRSHEVLKITQNSLVYAIPVSEDMAPNVYVSVLIIKGVDESNPRPDFKIGLAELKVDSKKDQLKITIQPDTDQAGPGDTVNFLISARDPNDKPVAAQLSVGLSDLATLSLVGPNSSPIYNYFYERRSLGVWTSLPLIFSIEEYNALMAADLATGEQMGSGGKGGGELGVVDVRQKFVDTAYWNAFLTTDQQGQARFSVTLPDNLTTWQMDVRGLTKGTQVGQATIEIVSTKPLLVEPQTTRFFVAGDEGKVGATLHNNTDQMLTVKAGVKVEGAKLLDADEQTVDLPAKGQAYVSWNIAVQADAQSVDLIFSASSGDYSDSSHPTAGKPGQTGLPVYRYEAMETVGTAGILADSGRRSESIQLPAGWSGDKGELSIRLDPSLAAGMLEGLTYLENYPYECMEQTVSRFLPNVMTMKAMKRAGVKDPKLSANLEQQVNQAFQKIAAWQNPDGGWGWWQNGQSDLQTSAYVVFGLAEAQQTGFGLDAQVIVRGLNYLQTVLPPISQLKEDYEFNREAFVLYVLQNAGTPDISKAILLYDQKQRLQDYAKGFLAFTLEKADPSDTRINTLLSELESHAINSATGAFWQEKENDAFNWNTDTRSTAIILSVLEEIDPGNELNANAVRWLMNHRVDGHWQSTQDTAWTILSLAGWMEKSGELNAAYNYSVAMNNKQLIRGSVNSANLTESQELKIQVSDLIKNQANRMVLLKDNPSGKLYYTTHLSLPLPVEQISALDNGVIVRREYFQQDQSRRAVSKAHAGDVLLARLTVVVPNDVHFLLVDDPLPAGFEAVDQSLVTSSQSENPQAYNTEDLPYKPWGWYSFDHVENRDEKITLSAQYLPAGTYVYNYLVRASSPGTYQVIPPTAQEFYFPEVYGRGSGQVFTILP